jgi:hypothetical protein
MYKQQDSQELVVVEQRVPRGLLVRLVRLVRLVNRVFQEPLLVQEPQVMLVRLVRLVQQAQMEQQETQVPQDPPLTQVNGQLLTPFLM